MTDDGNVEIVTSTELSKGAALEKAEETTQLDDRNISTDVGKGIKPPYSPARLASFIELNETHSVAIQKKAKREVGFGFDIVPHSSTDEDDASEEQRETVEDFWFGSDSRWKIGPEGTTQATPTEVLELARQDYHAVGWAALEILTQNDGTPIGLAHVPATTIRVRKTETEDGEVRKGHGYVQVKEGRAVYFGEAGDRYGDNPTFVDAETGEVGDQVDNPANELIFIPNPSPLELYYGIPDWVASIQTISGDQEAKRYNREFFEHNAIPHYAVLVKNGELTEESRKSLREMVHNLKGKPHRTAILEANKIAEQEFGDDSDIEIELEPLGAQSDEDMSFSEYRTWNEHEIAKVHEVPPQLLGRMEDSNRANIKEAIRDFALDVIAPEQSKFAARLYEILHKQALECPDWKVEFELRGAEQPAHEAKVAKTVLEAAPQAITVNEARSILPEDLEPLDDPLGSMTLAEVGGGGGGGVMEAIEQEVDDARERIESFATTEGFKNAAD